jgi:two-component system response regulator (stage 0 sporulation protein A)
MKNKIKVLVVDDDIRMCGLLKDHLRDNEDVCIAGSAGDGLQAIEMIRLLAPDVVILDVIMPNLDGIGVLERITTLKLKQKPVFIMLSAISQDTFIQKALALGAEYYMVKPVDFDILVKRVIQLFRVKQECPPYSSGTDGRQLCIKHRGRQQQSLEISVTYLIREAGIPPHLPGYRYIRDAIMHTVLNTSRPFKSITKVLYPVIAEKYGITPRKAERAIRSAIESSWKRCGQVFGNNFINLKGVHWKSRPKNAEFIAVLSDMIRLGDNGRY